MMTRPVRAPLPVSRVALALAVLTAVKVLGLRWMARWGADDEEFAATLPGDELVPHPDLTTTRAVTIDAIAEPGRARRCRHPNNQAHRRRGQDVRHLTRNVGHRAA